MSLKRRRFCSTFWQIWTVVPLHRCCPTAAPQAFAASTARASRSREAVFGVSATLDTPASSATRVSIIFMLCEHEQLSSPDLFSQIPFLVVSVAFILSTKNFKPISWPLCKLSIRFNKCGPSSNSMANFFLLPALISPHFNLTHAVCLLRVFL